MGQGTDSEGRNKIDSQPRRIYLYYFQQHQASKFYWWQPGDFIPVISMILSYQMFNAVFTQSWLYFQQDKQKGGDGLQTGSLEMADETALFTPKFGSDARYSLLTSLPFVLGMLDDRRPEHLNCRVRNKAEALS